MRCGRLGTFDFLSSLFSLLGSMIAAVYMFWFRRISANIFLAILAVMVLRYLVIVGYNSTQWFQPAVYVGMVLTVVVVLCGKRHVREDVLQQPGLGSVPF